MTAGVVKTLSTRLSRSGSAPTVKVGDRMARQPIVIPIIASTVAFAAASMAWLFLFYHAIVFWLCKDWGTCSGSAGDALAWAMIFTWPFELGGAAGAGAFAAYFAFVTTRRTLGRRISN